MICYFIRVNWRKKSTKQKSQVPQTIWRCDSISLSLEWRDVDRFDLLVRMILHTATARWDPNESQEYKHTHEKKQQRIEKNENTTKNYDDEAINSSWSSMKNVIVPLENRFNIAISVFYNL